MDDCLNFPPVRFPAILPPSEDFAVSLVNDDNVQEFRITNPLTADTMPDSNEACAALHALCRMREALTSPFNTPDCILDRPTWLRMVLETFAGVHEGFCNAQLASPDETQVTAFLGLSKEEFSTVGHIYQILMWIADFCNPVEKEHDNDHIPLVCTLCICCIESANLPPPKEHALMIQLGSTLEARAYRETLRNEVIRKAIMEIDDWCETQRAGIIAYLTSTITSYSPDSATLARQLGVLSSDIQDWVENIRPALRLVAVRMVNAKIISDVFDPQAHELLENTWAQHRQEIHDTFQSRYGTHESDLGKEYVQHQETAQLDVESALETAITELQVDADRCLAEAKSRIDTDLADNITKLKNESCAALQLLQSELPSRDLSLVACTSKPTKPSPLNITKPKKAKKPRKHHILDLVTPSPPDVPDTDMETDTDTTPMTPVAVATAFLRPFPHHHSYVPGRLLQDMEIHPKTLQQQYAQPR